MEDFEWQDPLLITDACSHQHEDRTQIQSQIETHCELTTSCSSEASIMDNPDDSSPLNIDGRSVLGFSFTSPDLVICVGSPDITNQRYEELPEFLKGERMDVSLENGIEGSQIRDSFRSPGIKLEDSCTESSFELATSPLFKDNLRKDSTHVISINVGSTQSIEFHEGIYFSEDNSFSGGDTIKTEDPIIGDGEGLSLYQTARVGNCLYHFDNLGPGSYMVDLHFAEIVDSAGPPGKRIFDVFLKEDKVISCLDIYARVGANKPLVISDLKTYVNEDEGLTLRFEGVNGIPIVSGISIRRDSNQSSTGLDLSQRVGCTYIPQCEINVIQNDSADGDYNRLQKDHELLKWELSEMKKILKDLRRENELKSSECQEAWISLKELQNELIRKSMHVGSLAFAVEGQVKEKSRWFSSLRDLTRKLKILKMDHLKLLEEASLFKQYFEDVKDVRAAVQSIMDQQAQLYENIKLKLLQEVKERKQLYNKVLELKGNIRVFCRCRPLNDGEIISGAIVGLDFEAAKDGELTVKSNGIPKKTYKFDNVFRPEADQVDVFEETAPLAVSVLDGYNVCIFAYGQTGTGKTFTMEGTSEARGVNYRTLEKLFDIIEERKNTFRYEVSVSVLEVYNEQIRDLLVSGSQPGINAKTLEIKQASDGGHHVPGLVEAHVKNVSEVWEVLCTGSNGRAVGSTNVNEHSSRSHCMHCVMVKGENLLNGECTRSKLWLVDLAGSERIAKTEVQGERLKETQNINRSLSALGDVISALATKSSHIPFRNSKLTHLLQDSLGGDSKALMFVQISPNENDLNETLCSLNFASRVRGIELGPAKKQTDTTELLRQKQMVEKLKVDLKGKDFQVKKMEDVNYCLELKLKEKDMKNKSLQDKIKELESQLMVERKLARQHVDSRIAEQQTKQLLDECSREPLRAPLTTKIPPFHKPQTESRDQENAPHPYAESDKFSYRPLKITDFMEKENNPIMTQPLQLPKRTGRASLCPNLHKISVAPAPRRNSLIPLRTISKISPIILPLSPIQADKAEDNVGEEASTCLPEQTPCGSPKEKMKNEITKKMNGAFRRSLQKRIHTKSPMQLHVRRVGVNVGMEKVRVSIGGRGRTGQKVLLGSARRAVGRENQQKQSQRDKEKRWNIGSTAAKILL